MTITEYTFSPAAAATGDVFSVYCKVQMGADEYADQWVCMLNKFGDPTYNFLYFEIGGAIPAGGSATISFTAAMQSGSVTLTRGDALGLKVMAYHGDTPTHIAVTSSPVCTWLGNYSDASITSFNVRRFASGAASDIGTVAALDLKIATGLPAGATCAITYKESDSDTFSAPISVTLASAQAGMTANTVILSAVTLQIGTAYDFRVTVGDAYESAIKQVRVSRGIGKLNISSAAPGVAIGMMSTATPGAPKFESAYPAHFGAEIYDANGNDMTTPGWTLLALSNGATTSDTAIGNGRLRYRIIGKHVIVAGGITIEWSGTAKAFCTLPVGPAYANQTFLKGCGGGNIARVTVSKANKTIELEWVKAISNGADVTTFNTWLDCNLDFWID